MRMCAHRMRLLAAGIVATTALVIAGAVAAPVSSADWSDGERAAGEFAAGVVTPPTHLVCASGLEDDALRFTWTRPSGGLSRTEYRWTLGSKSGTVDGTANAVNVPASTLGVILNGTFSMQAVGPGGWRSEPVTATVTTVEIGLIIKVVVILSCVSHNP